MALEAWKVMLGLSALLVGLGAVLAAPTRTLSTIGGLVAFGVTIYLGYRLGRRVTGETSDGD